MNNIGIIGPDTTNCTKEIYDFGVSLGEHLAIKDRFIICGGMGGFMEAVCSGVKKSANTFNGQTIGILADDKKECANKFIDIPIPTGIGFARNIIIVNSSDIIIAAGGGAGTLSELAFAWQKKKKVLCISAFNGWAKELGGRQLDKRYEGLFIPVKGIDEILSHLNIR
ncbi:MAG: TIGR00725 family protein [Ignavibacteria bacterium]|nr:TIGR00725 family protein [Ignavibacteria bacterium]